MTQKEYKEKIAELENENKRLKKELEIERDKTYNNEHLLEQYYAINEQLRAEQRLNMMNNERIENQTRVIDRYEKILDKFTFNYGG